MEDEAITVSIPRASRILGIGTTLLQELLAAGEIPSVRLGRRRLIPLDSLRAFIAAKAKEG